MTLSRLLVLASVLVTSLRAHAQVEAPPVAGFNLSEIGEHLYDASESGPKTSAQDVVDKLHALGVRHIVLNPRATMNDPRGTEITPVTPAAQRGAERQRYARLIKYIKGKGMTVGIRPIFFVVNAQGGPFREPQADGSPDKVWWHGNIQPKDPNKWFESFKTYIDAYLLIAKATGADEFTIGAELYSMTVGVEDQWRTFPYGFPGRWLELLRYARSRLGAGTRIMYDINFTDAVDNSSGISAAGGEFERWRYRIVDLANRTDPAERKIWQDLVDFWTGLDAVGIDHYRSLASRTATMPTEYSPLVDALKETGDRYASQIDNALAEIELTVGKPQKIIFKEIGFKSVNRSYLDPFSWDEGDPTVKLNRRHQAAAYDATFRSLWAPGWSWFGGIVFWDASMDPRRHGPEDKGFSPLGKKETEDVIKSYFE